MAGLCFNCKQDIEGHDSQKVNNCLTALSKRLESMETVLQIPNDDEALDYFRDETMVLELANGGLVIQAY